ncbi:hypothetical protein ABPG75_002046 [Micractinium tetrahymenae]
MLRLDIPDWKPPPDGEAGPWEDDTPREPRAASSLPASPSARKTKSRAARSYMRNSSLRDAKVLVVSDMHRTESAMDPALFLYHQHFESPWQLVGKTSLSEVFRVRHRTSGEVFAVKRSRRRFRSKLQRERCLREIRAVAALPTHPNIVNQYRAWQEGGHFYIQMDFCEGGSLAQWAQKACMQGQCLTDDQLWSTACQAAQGLAFLHSHNVMHLDIKPENIYLSAASGLPGGARAGPGAVVGWATCRIGDFGLAVAREQDGSMDWEEGDGDYVAPELLSAGGEPSPAADIFSLGATLYECATGRRLPRSNGWGAADVAALQVERRPAAFVQLLRTMLQPNPGLRPSAQQVIEAVCHSDGSADFAFTPGHPQPLRPPNGRRASGGSGGPPGTALKVRGTPAGRGGRAGHARWAPALSPLISEGALTPGAAAALAGLTPGPRRGSSSSSEGAPTPQLLAPGSGHAAAHAAAGGGATPLDLRRPAPLQLPPQTAAVAMLTSGNAGVLSGSAAHGSGGTQDSRDGWRLSRRDILSPDSDFYNTGSHSESDYSYSCGTGRTTSDMEFADALSPMSAERGFLAGGHTPSSGTPESIRCGSTPGSAPQHQQQPPTPQQPSLSPSPLQQAAAEQGQPQQGAAPSLAWDLHTSPEFLMQLPPGSPASLSRSSSLDDTTSLPSRALSVRRFPTLDSWGSHLDAAGSRPPHRIDSLAALAAQRFTNTFGQQQQAPAASSDQGQVCAAAVAQQQQGAAAAAAPSGCPAPSAPQPVGGRALRKRQHSSRRALMAALSRDNSVASSIDGMAPLGKARHIMESGGASPADCDPQQPHPLHRTASMLGREAAAALADATAKAFTMAAAAAGLSPAPAAAAADISASATPSHLLIRDISFGPAAQGLAAAAEAGGQGRMAAPPSPLHARMTGLKLRSTD